MNKVILIGNLTRDPELSFVTGSGTAVAKFTLAVQRFKKDEADFINCVVFGKIAENVAQYTQKGSKIAVEGSIKTGSYNDKDGNKRYTTDVICNNVEFLSKSSKNEDSIAPTNNVRTEEEGITFTDEFISFEDGDNPFL